MPESVTDRPTKAHEYLFLLAKSERYFYDAESIKEQGTGRASGRIGEDKAGSGPGFEIRGGFSKIGDVEWHARNRRSVWTIATEPYPEAHFATFPPDLVKPCVLAGTSERGACAQCGAPWERVVEVTSAPKNVNGRDPKKRCAIVDRERDSKLSGQEFVAWKALNPNRTTGWRPTCACNAATVPCVVLDPFAGAGTALYVAKELGRKTIGIELNQAYVALAAERLRQDVLNFTAQPCKQERIDL
jgi:hypothetical protein